MVHSDVAFFQPVDDDTVWPQTLDAKAASSYGETVSEYRTAQSYNGRARTRECVDSDSGDDAKQARERTFHARSRSESGEVLRRCRQARGEERRFVNKCDGKETMKALKDAEAEALEGVESKIRTRERVRPKDVPAPEVDVEKKGLDRKTNHQPRRSQGRQSRHRGERRYDRSSKFVVACTLVRGGTRPQAKKG